MNYALITETGGRFKVQYSPNKQGANPQYLTTHSSAKQFANQYEPTGKVIDASQGPVNAEMSSYGSYSPWTKYTDCKLHRRKTRKVLYPAFNGGTTGKTYYTQTKSEPAKDAAISDWSEWSECAGGIKTRTKTITSPAKCGGLTPVASELTEEGVCCSDANATEETDGSCKCNDGYSMNDDAVCEEDIATDDSTDDTSTDTTVTTQTAVIAPVTVSSGMGSGTKALLAIAVLGGGFFLYKKSKA